MDVKNIMTQIIISNTFFKQLTPTSKSKLLIKLVNS